MSDKTFIKNSALTFSRNIVTILFNLIITIIIARILGPEKQGVYALIILLPNMLVMFLNLGFGAATVYYIGKQKYKLTTIISTNIIASIFLSIFAIIIGIVVVNLFSNTFFKGVPIAYILSILSVIPLLFFNTFLQAIFQGTQNFKDYNSIGAIGRTVNLIVLILIILLAHLNLWGASIAFVLSQVITTVFILYMFRKNSYPLTTKEFSRSFLKDCLSYGYKAHLSNILAFVNYRADILLISYFINPVAVGIYTVAVNITERLWIISQPVSTVLFPRLSSTENAKEHTELTAKVSRNVLFLSIAVGIFFYYLSDLMVFILFGKEYTQASIIIKILLPGITLFSAERILSSYFAANGKTEINLYTSLFTVVGNVVINIILVPHIGINGAALATSITYVLAFLLKAFLFCKATEIKPNKIIFPDKSDIRMYKILFTKLVKKDEISK